MARLTLAALAIASPTALAATATKDSIYADLRTLADVQLKALGNAKPIDWVGGVMYAGLAEFAKASGDPKYTDALVAVGNAVKWEPIDSVKEPYHADRVVIGQMFLSLYEQRRDPVMIEPLRRIKLDPLVERLNDDSQPKLAWWWCDALFMAPPVLAQMSAVSGDLKYVNAMHKEWWRVSAALYDPAERLYFRDHTTLKFKSKNGQKEFWSRGNGWVFGGLARVLTYLPADDAQRPKYVEQFKQMAGRLKALQPPDGLWRASLLDAGHFPIPETSGTAFYCYGMAWGVNNGLLDKNEYRPVIARAWSGLLAARRSDGLLGYVQGVAHRPYAARPAGTQLYATGAFLLAGLEVAELAPLDLPPQPVLPRPAATTAATVAAEAKPRAYARFVPERKDDFVWENDRVAFRVYGPTLQRDEPPPLSGSGIDVWCKSVRRLVVDQWYQMNDYHADHGEGLDYFHVGESRGSGGLGVWADGKLHVSGNWATHAVQQRGGDKAVFDLTYAPWDAGGRKVSEKRTITLATGTNLSRIESTIDSDTPGDLILGIGVTRNPIKAIKADPDVFKDKDKGVLAAWSPTDPKHGSIGYGVAVDPAMIVGFERDRLNDLVLIKVTPGKPFVYYAGGCWSKGQDFKTFDAWKQHLTAFERKD